MANSLKTHRNTSLNKKYKYTIVYEIKQKQRIKECGKHQKI